MKIYPALSAAVWGWDGVDGSRAYWMTLPFWEVLSISGFGMLLGLWAQFFIIEKKDILLARVYLPTIHLFI